MADEEWDERVTDTSILHKDKIIQEQLLDEDVKDSWEIDSDDERAEKEKQEEEERKKRAALEEERKRKLAESKRKKKQIKELMQNDNAGDDDDFDDGLTDAERRQRNLELSRNSDLDIAKNLFGDTGSSSGSLTLPDLDSSDQFNEYAKTLASALSKYKDSDHYASFLDELCRELCIDLLPADMRKISNNITNLALAKEKQDKEGKKKAGKKKGGAKLSQRDDFYEDGDEDMYAEYEDFL